MESLQVIHHPHPTLYRKSLPIIRVDSELVNMVEQMFALMYQHKGIGLAANQVDLPFQLFVLNLAGQPDAGEELVFINPVIQSPKGSATAEEGCLSIPNVYGDVPRPDIIHVKAYNLQGELFDQTVSGLMSRAIQHENDHLHGVLFPDRMNENDRRAIAADLEDFEIEFSSRRQTGSIPDDATIERRLVELEARYCK